MKLTWYGHASFRVTANDGTAIVLDPYTPETSGYSAVRDPADLVIASSDNDSFHCRHDLIPGSPDFVNALTVAEEGGSTDWRGLGIKAIQTMEMDGHPTHDPEQNAMYRFTVDGVDIAHMGDVGNPLSPRQIDFLSGADVLLALTGDVPTIRLPNLKVAIDEAAPRIVVPMHFRTLTYRPRNGLWVESFLSLFREEDIDFAFAPEITLTPDDIPAKTRVLVMDYAR
ncbi:MAG: MBL fold metallo-hydrolase [Pseudomonadota bacterium]